MPNEITQITYISWQPLWTYWPIYLAMEKTERMVNGLRFVRDMPSAPSDEKIRKSLAKTVQRRERDGGSSENFTMALCEPGRERDGSDRQLRGLKIRKLPLVWRQPHWVITHRKNIPELAEYRTDLSAKLKFYEMPLDTLPRGATIYCYPRKTTSGDYVRAYFQKIEMRSKRVFKLRNANVHNERSVWSKEGNNYLVSFTPWHQFDQRLAAISELPGAVRDISALLIPEQQIGHAHIQVGQLYHKLSTNLKQILASLDDTQGDPRYIKAYVEKYHQRVCTFLKLDKEAMTPDQLEVDMDWRDSNMMTKFLTEYIKRGCYFPYQVIEEAFGSELSYLLEDEAAKYHDRLVEGTKDGLNRLFGFKRDWSELNFAERISAHVRWEPKSPDNPGGDPRTLHEYLTHIHQEKSAKTNDPQFAFEMINVQTGEDEDAVALTRFNGRDRLFFCAERGTNNGGERRRDIFGHCSAVSGEITAQQAQEQAQNPFNPCLACVVSGLPGAVLRGGAKMLAEEMLTAYPAVAAQASEPSAPSLAAYQGVLKSNITDPSRPFSTLLCWPDVEPVFKTFCSEMRKPDINGKHPPCRVVMVSDDQFVEEGHHHTLLAVLWRGGTEKGKTGVGARGKLLSWARELNKDGKEVGLVSFWVRKIGDVVDDNGNLEYVYQKNSDFDSLGSYPMDELWRIAREIAKEGEYNFAYVTVFNYPPALQEVVQ
jgi:hypothetical protein